MTSDVKTNIYMCHHGRYVNDRDIIKGENSLIILIDKKIDG